MNQWIAYSIELLKDFGLLICGNTDSVIDDLKVDAAIVPVEAYPKVFLRRRVLHSVVHQIQQRTCNRFAVHPHWGKIAVDLLLELESVLLNFKTIRLEGAPHQIGHIGFAEAVFFLARLDAREVQNIVDQRSQPLTLLRMIS